jgi:hypothetical protein
MLNLLLILLAMSVATTVSIVEQVLPPAESHQLYQVPRRMTFEGRDVQKSVIISSWISMSLIGASDGPLKKEQFPWLARGIQAALSSSLGVCQASLHVVDMMNAGDGLISDGLVIRKHGPSRPFYASAALINGITRLVRSDEDKDVHKLRDMNYTRVKAFFEVRIFPAMRASSEEINARIDRLQIYSRFAELSHELVQSLGRRPTSQTAETVLLDDIGFAVQKEELRPSPTDAEMGDCIEEGLLQDARQTHQYVVALACLLVVLITCAGSSIFALKHPTLVPSRTNPLMPPPTDG